MKNPRTRAEAQLDGQVLTVAGHQVAVRDVDDLNGKIGLFELNPDQKLNAVGAALRLKKPSVKRCRVAGAMAERGDSPEKIARAVGVPLSLLFQAKGGQK